MDKLFAISGDPDQMPHSAGSDLWSAPFSSYPFRGLLTTITKKYLYNFDPLKPHFYAVKLGFAGV